MTKKTNRTTNTATQTHAKIMSCYKKYTLMKTNWKENTRETYLDRLAKLDFSTTDTLVQSLTMVRAKYAPKTYNNTLNALTNVRKALEFFKQFPEYVEIIEVLQDQRISHPHVKHYKPYSEEQVNKLLNYRSDYFRMAFWIAFNLGLRASEIEALNIEDIDLEEGIVTVVESKHDKTRYVPVADMSEFRKYMAIRTIKARNGKITGNHFLFNRDGNRPSLTESGGPFTAAKYGTKTKPGLGFYPSLHRARSQFITMALRSGMDIDVVSQMAGHESLDTTKGYIDTDLETMKKQTKKMGLLVRLHGPRNTR